MTLRNIFSDTGSAGQVLTSNGDDEPTFQDAGGSADIRAYGRYVGETGSFDPQYAYALLGDVTRNDVGDYSIDISGCGFTKFPIVSIIVDDGGVTTKVPYITNGGDTNTIYFFFRDGSGAAVDPQHFQITLIGV